MATPHHIPALPTASPVTVGLRGAELVRSTSERLLLQRIRRRIAAGQRKLNLMLGPSTGRTRLALAAALDIGGDVLVLTTSSRRRRAWRTSFRRLGDLDQAQRTAGTRGSALTCITFSQLAALQSADDDELRKRDPLAALSVVVVDAARLRRPARHALEHLLDQKQSPVVLSLPLQFDRPSGVPVQDQVFAEPGLLVKSGQMAPYQQLYWLAPVSPERQATLDLDVRCALRIIDRLATSDEPRHLGVARSVPDLARFIARALPKPDPGASRRHAWLTAFARSPGWTRALVRTHLSLGGTLPSPVSQLLDVAVELDKAPTLRMWSRVLNEYRRRLATTRSEDGIRRRELAREALERLGFGDRKYAHPSSRLRPVRLAAAAVAGCTQVIEQERKRRPESRALVLVDQMSHRDSRVMDPGEVARQLTAKGIAAIALQGSGLWAPASIRKRLLKAIRPHHPSEDIHVSDDGIIRFLGDVDWNPVAAWIHWALEQKVCRTVVCAPELLAGLTRHAGPRGARPLAHFVIDLRSSSHQPLPLTVCRVLDPRTTGGVVNLWRVLPCAPRHPLGSRTLREALATSGLVASPTDDGRLQYGNMSIRQVLDSELTESVIERFNREMWARAERLDLARENWRSISGRRQTVPVVHVRSTRKAPLPFAVKTNVEGGAAMSEIRARHRHHKLLNHRRHVLAQSAIACIITALVLPTVAGPVLGSIVGLSGVLFMLGRTRRKLHRTRLATVARPESTTAVMRDIACIVLRTLRSCEGIPQSRLPTSRIRCSEGPRGDLAIWLDSHDSRLARLFADAVAEALGPIVAHRYIIGRPETVVPGRQAEFETYVASYHPVPSIFGSRRQRAELFAGHWAQVFGAGKLRYTAGGKGRLLRFVHFGRNHLGLIAHRATALD